jgi:hypothetical protein
MDDAQISTPATRIGIVSSRFQTPPAPPPQTPTRNETSSYPSIGNVFSSFTSLATRVAHSTLEKASQGMEYVRERFEPIDEKPVESTVDTTESIGLIFGVEAGLATQRSRLHDALHLPAVFVRCVQFLDMHALETEGLYRTAGSLRQVQELKRKFDNASDVDLETLSDQVAVPTVSSLLKSYLRELPEPLIPEFVAEELDIPDDDALEITRDYVLESLADDSLRHIFRFLMLHLHRVSKRANMNKMTASNLALVFAPTLGVHGKVEWLRYWIEEAYVVFPSKSWSGELPREMDMFPEDLTWCSFVEKEVGKEVEQVGEELEQVGIDVEQARREVQQDKEVQKLEKADAFRREGNPFKRDTFGASQNPFIGTKPPALKPPIPPKPKQKPTPPPKPKLEEWTLIETE